MTTIFVTVAVVRIGCLVIETYAEWIRPSRERGRKGKRI